VKDDGPPAVVDSAFRSAEKRYRWRKRTPTDFTDVVDCASPAEARATRVRCGGGGADAYAIDGAPGLFVLPGALDLDAQALLAASACREYARSPFTNLTALGAAPRAASAGPPDRALRWVTLGAHYDWSSRAYAAGRASPLPRSLAALAGALAARVGESLDAEAAIVNYYAPGATMGGHVDDAENDRTKALVSLSVGCSCVFLFGGPTRDAAPVALFLRSGDACVLSGPARDCYHGVPRVLEGTCPARLSRALDADLRDYLGGTRINVNVREVG